MDPHTNDTHKELLDALGDQAPTPDKRSHRNKKGNEKTEKSPHTFHFEKLSSRASIQFQAGTGTMLRALHSEGKIGWDAHQLGQGMALSTDCCTVWKTSTGGFSGAVGAQLYSSGMFGLWKAFDS